MIQTRNIDIDIEIDEDTVMDWFDIESPYSVATNDAKNIYDSCCYFYECNHHLSPAQRVKADFDQLDEDEQRELFYELRKKYPMNEDEA